MPTYEYICEACAHEFEKFQSIKADAITLCPSCGKEQVRRKISTGAGILFKGGGFYETDYRSAGYKEAAKKDSDGGGASESKSETKSADTASPAKADAPKADPKPAAAPAPTPANTKPSAG
ncbi:MAG TPA: zinc ribbon domain-containing protein [Tepidisphaeraceae bacterium]|jgi:putative FmdB family regulatory protein